ncbi:kinetoplastid kinetochore protein 15 [Trypanosoma equiperdum]|uniref:Uncharacterized protein n=2 Tax=Trypanozoon TaxID=39700 RepID=Q585X4_TRYB2|nr:hypothetical protein, conserved [Trypanosoma brucei brucei TREU927]AAX80769.1 hypothetical protein, conserved [Trypanosoma brucei]AAZ11935.1 hypothetical protein, conserved [Trypanosoma brucei brucei TREU927]SCU69414.1 kinetoplastid kinetochore protein 15 [Trypanosoma equiperdum]
MKLERSSCFEVQGCISCLTQASNEDACLASTMMNGAHIFHMGDLQHAQCGARQAVTHVETFPHGNFGEGAVISSSFVSYDSCFATGSSSGDIVLVSRHSKNVVQHYSFQNKAAVLSLKEVPNEPSLLLACSPTDAQIIDLETSTARINLHIPKPCVVGGTALTQNTLVVAAYDGKAMLYDVRRGHEPVVILAVPDQIISITSSPDTGAVATGTVSGRVFVLRCLEGNVREEAFSTGKERAPIRSVAMRNGYIAAGDTSAKLTCLDLKEDPKPTRYWDLHSLLTNESGPPSSGAEKLSSVTVPDTESWSLPAVMLQQSDLWAALSSTKYGVSHILAIPI